MTSTTAHSRLLRAAEDIASARRLASHRDGEESAEVAVAETVKRALTIMGEFMVTEDPAEAWSIIVSRCPEAVDVDPWVPVVETPLPCPTLESVYEAAGVL